MPHRAAQARSPATLKCSPKKGPPSPQTPIKPIYETCQNSLGQSENGCLASTAPQHTCLVCEERRTANNHLQPALVEFCPYWFIILKNSLLVFVLRNLSSKNSMLSTIPIGCKIRRSTQIFCRLASSNSISSCRVPLLAMSIAG